MSSSGSQVTNDGPDAPLAIPEDVPITLEFVGNCLHVGGIVDVAGSPWLDRALLRLDEHDPVDIDLSAVKFIDSSGLRCLLLGARRAHSRSATLRLVAVSDPVARLLELTGTEQLFTSAD